MSPTPRKTSPVEPIKNSHIPHRSGLGVSDSVRADVDAAAAAKQPSTYGLWSRSSAVARTEKTFTLPEFWRLLCPQLEKCCLYLRYILGSPQTTELLLQILSHWNWLWLLADVVFVVYPCAHQWYHNVGRVGAVFEVWHRWLFQDTTDSSPPSNMKILGIRFGVRIVGHLQEFLVMLDWYNLRNVKHRIPTKFRGAVLQILVRLAQSFGELPPHVYVSVKIGPTQLVRWGGFGNIHRSSGNGDCLALKVPRPSRDVRGQVDFIREVLLIWNIRHKYILPVYGVTSICESNSPCLAMRWMANETVLHYLRDRRPQAYRLLTQIAQALSYLHAHDVVHADLRGANILVDDEGNALLADFGYATFANAPVSFNRGYYVTNDRWAAPELLVPKMFGRDECDQRPTKATDIYSFGILCWEMYTLRFPFGNFPVAGPQVISGARPNRPTAALHDLEMPEKLWDLVVRCWCEDVAIRPTIAEVVATLSSLHNDS